MARTRYGKTFTTRRGRRGRYKYVNNRRVGFVATKSRRKKGYYHSRYRGGNVYTRRRRY